MDRIYYDSQSELCKVPFGAVPCGTRVIFRIFAEDDPVGVYLQINEQQILLARENRNTFVLEYTTPPEGGLVFYSFFIRYRDETVSYGKHSDHSGIGSIGSTLPYQLTVYDETEPVPEWFYQSVIYQIFPDRFYRPAKVLNPKPNCFLYGNWNDLPMYIKDEKQQIARWDFYGGNLFGIIEKLSYIKSLGASVIYLNPVFSSRSNHRYDTADYNHVDPMLGGDDALSALIEAAKAQGIRLILDGVFNHTGQHSLYFDRDDVYGNGAYQHPDSPYRNWYTFFEDGRYLCWWDVDDLPMVNELDTSYLDYMVTGENSIVKKWMKTGIIGWRLDVADELPDAFLEALRNECRSINPESVMIGEVWEDASNKESYGEQKQYFTKHELDSVTNYPFRTNLLDFFQIRISAYRLCERFNEQMENYPKRNFYAAVNLLGSHDVERIMTVAAKVTGNKTDGKSLVKQLVAIQFLFAGIPLVYYGDETGLEGGKDPDNRRTYPWGREDQELIGWYRKMAQIRNTHPVLQTGYIRFWAMNEDVFCFMRYFKAGLDILGKSSAPQTATVLANRSGNSYPLPEEFAGAADLLSGRIPSHINPSSVLLFMGNQSQ